ncbi:DUF2207 domain-containing protein [Candidatus Saccharibacteria bacterium]|nr:DUF2207 domain-containing protein [Candidatus Saccharibacteria bacterium]
MDTENFKFTVFTGDYYLSRDAEGISHLKVVQSMTALFPAHQNKGICLVIPNSNQDGENLTLPRLTKNDITVTRNGAPEPIYSIDKYIDSYEVCTGTDEYVEGEQVYEFTYNYEKVITDFGETQELTWDTNGTEWAQEFDHLTARVHMPDDIKANFTGNTLCAVGAFMENDDSRCITREISDGVEFTTGYLEGGENLTYALQFNGGTFSVPAPEISYALVWLLVVFAILCAGILVYPILKFMATREKRQYYKGLFVKPEYQPDPRYTLSEMTEVYLGKKRDYKVGILLSLATTHRTEIVKGERNSWSLNIKNLKGIRPEEMKLLEILNGGASVREGGTVKIETHLATSTLVRLSREMTDGIVADLKRDGLVESKYKFRGPSSLDGVASTITVIIIWSMFACFLAIGIIPAFENMIGLNGFVGVMVLQDVFFQIVFAMIIITVVIIVLLKKNTQKYSVRTKAGLAASRYMEGLETYIRMAEADRLKFLQSVEGADTTSEGIVKLYEKLLPYAAIFGLEESWMGELQKYCEVHEIEEPDYMRMGITASEISRLARTSALTATRSSTMSSSSSGFSSGGGFSSSGSSFGGGGFSSGSGGGGGGGHGR